MNNIIAGYRRMLDMNQKQMSSYLGISIQAYRNKEQGKTEFKRNEMQAFVTLLKTIVPDATVTDVFFNEKVLRSTFSEV